jgi:small subunit ribosomal protein S15
MVENMNQEKFKKHEKDTGSSSVQIVALSNDINLLTLHMNVNKKDFACRRSLLAKVAKRRSLLAYLKRTDEGMYKEVTSTLGLKR